MDTKYTKDGKKVAVIGKLNNEQWIVQEIFVTNGKEFPAGENFTTKTLLDEPAETWQIKQARELEQSKEKIKLSIKKLEDKRAIILRKSRVAELINRNTDTYSNIDLGQLDTLMDFMAGKITHLIVKDYHGYEIKDIIDSVEAIDNCGYRKSLDGLRLVSLFGCSTRGQRYKEGKDAFSCRLDWRINRYRDDSGHSWDEVIPCKSHEEAVALVDELVSQEDKATKGLIALKEKYNLDHPIEEKIQAYYKATADQCEKCLKEAQEKALKLTKDAEKARGMCKP